MTPKGVSLLLVAAVALGCAPGVHDWSEEDLEVLESLSIDSLPPLPPDPSNAVGDDPAAVALGHRLYFDVRFSGNGEISCATCHQPDRFFTDGLPLAEAIGTTRRHAPTIVGTAYNPWFYWDGRRDSQWAQAVSPMEDPVEHGGTRTQYAWLIARHYREEFEALFGPLPDLTGLPPSAGPTGSEEQQAAWTAMTPEQQGAVNAVYAGIGKAIAAYERRIVHGASRFDRYVEAARAGDREAMASTFSDAEVLGLRLFIGDANCTDCHNGPMLTNQGFHNIAVDMSGGTDFDMGRVDGVQQALDFVFNCRSPYSDAADDECDELNFAKLEGLELIGAMKVPSLRSVAETAPYMHTGEFDSLRAVLEHYNAAIPPQLGHSDLVPLELTDEEIAGLEAFLRTLTAPPAAPTELLEPPAG